MLNKEITAKEYCIIYDLLKDASRKKDIYYYTYIDEVKVLLKKIETIRDIKSKELTEKENQERNNNYIESKELNNE